MIIATVCGESTLTVCAAVMMPPKLAARSVALGTVPSQLAPADQLLVPMDHRTVAAPGGDNEYAHYASGGWSWCTPYIAGAYALACQVNSTLTPDQFWAAALKTGEGGGPLALGGGAAVASCLVDVGEVIDGVVACELRLVDLLRAGCGLIRGSMTTEGAWVVRGAWP